MENLCCIRETFVSLHAIFIASIDVVLETAVEAPLHLAMTRSAYFVRCIQLADLRRCWFSAGDTPFLCMAAASTSTVSPSGISISQFHLDFVRPVANLCVALDRLSGGNVTSVGLPSALYGIVDQVNLPEILYQGCNGPPGLAICILRRTV